jgi:hypothetical protein
VREGGDTMRIGIVIWVVCMLFAPVQNAYAGIHPHSIFAQARDPASELDLELSDAQHNWNLYLLYSGIYPKDNPSPIQRCVITLDLSYSGLEDKIAAEGCILSLNGFLSLNCEERKQLVHDFLEQVWSRTTNILVVDKQTGKGPRVLEKAHIKLSLRLIEPHLLAMRAELPFGYAWGQAGYSDGQFFYSEDYYLGLRIVNGKPAEGDPSKFVVEKEK